MAKNYAALARSVIAALGGVDNISAVTHCMTRLRFVIKDDQLIDSPTLKTISGVLGVVRSDNQCHKPFRKSSACCREICSPHSPWVNPNLRYVALVRGSSMR
mgnify:CR=1 FL=1